MLDIDGSAFAGSGMIVRQAVAYAAVTGTSIRVFNARARRPSPGLRPQHVCAVEAVRAMVGGILRGVLVGSREFRFEPGGATLGGVYRFEVGTSGSATALSLALLPVAATATEPVELRLVGGLFQDLAPSPFHIQHVLVPLLARMGLLVSVDLVRPGYVPSGGGEIHLQTRRLAALSPVVSLRQQAVGRVWGIALASHLSQRRVTARMAGAARRVLAAGGYPEVRIEEREDDTAAQRGAGLALFAELADGMRIGADRAGALRRSAERIGSTAAAQLLETIATGATVDRFTADQILVFAALASGRSVLRLPAITDHVRTGLWLMDLFGCGSWALDGRLLTIQGHGLPGRLPQQHAPRS